MKQFRKRINSDNFESPNKYQCNDNSNSKLCLNIDNESNRQLINVDCISTTCTHQENNKKFLIKEIKTLNDLINLAKQYNCISYKEYNGINLRILNKLIEPLTELNNMIGLDEIKNKLIDQLLYLTRGYNSIKCNTCIDCLLNISCCANSKEMLHTVITGSPGVGKTEFARILAKIYACCGFIKNDKIIEITRKDLISGYLGRTAKKTSKLFKKAKSSVIFLDEAYSLGNTGNDDSYSKECIDIINKQLSENKDIIFIIAGYEKDINECFFRINSGLERRFPFKYNINGYNGEELFKIFEYKIKKDNWNIEKNDYEKIKKYIISNYKKYNNFAGDMEILLMKAKIKHSRNLNSKKYILTLNDIS